MTRKLDTETLLEIRDNAQTSMEQFLAMELLSILRGRPENCFSEDELREFGKEMFFAGWRNSRYDPNPNYEFSSIWRESPIYDRFHNHGVPDAEIPKQV